MLKAIITISITWRLRIQIWANKLLICLRANCLTLAPGFSRFVRGLRRTVRKAFLMATTVVPFFEWFTRRRLAILVGILIICSLFILLFEEYVEDSFAKADKLFRRQPSNLPHPICPSNGGVGANTSKSAIFATLTQHCQRCNDFELKALQSEHCRPTGYFDVYTCPAVAEYKVDNGTKSHHTIIYKPCLTMSRDQESDSFYMFCMASMASTVLSALYVRWRRELIERRAFGSSAHSYARLATAVGDN
ncbi:hypothetical protein niasHT_026672 [Heterodera trifolii]|uniref:Protein JTB n=1 Tax=Heterodera trifolii TaxID=157864 RepID=A0ABD2JSS0_9BILA